MQLSSTKGQESCTDVAPRFAWNDERIDIGFSCSHGTIIWLSMTPREAQAFLNNLTRVVTDTKP